ncbi:hypothetical protein HBA55_34730 [Pseudomaricurvus alkylphenolicus]|uniref:hypothetical protein n=1 Tax=Pseudomaricurvus alkylphenolicus TaxID=1306991 RepID=UPI00141E13F8|nr:hypothetical protein [Pseudomaricurvus alkylphenolicus]NIB44788.1 hypothetical protein [Pseudomaricurvus alkylphenolicus]
MVDFTEKNAEEMMRRLRENLAALDDYGKPKRRAPSDMFVGGIHIMANDMLPGDTIVVGRELADKIYEVLSEEAEKPGG